jgi:dTDP-4-dehydrorhamnose reductase
MVTGAAGQLGSTLVARLSASCQVFPFMRSQLDITDEVAVLERTTALGPDVVINCAAYNDVDGAEDQAPAALAANALGPLALAHAAQASGAVLVHYSTDFVFDGEGDRPYVESDRPRPLSTYGASKLLGEWFAGEVPAYILRVESLFGGQPAKGSIDRILAAIRVGQPVRAFTDRTVTPSYVEDVASATEQLLLHRPPFGVYHCVNTGATTWFGIAEEGARLLEKDAEIIPVSVDTVKSRARRPRNCALSNQKLHASGVGMPTWQDALARYCQSSLVSRS